MKKFVILLACVAGMLLISCGQTDRRSENVSEIETPSSSLIRCKAMSDAKAVASPNSNLIRVYATFVSEEGQVITLGRNMKPCGMSACLDALINVVRDDICYLRETENGYVLVTNETRRQVAKEFAPSYVAEE